MPFKAPFFPKTDDVEDFVAVDRGPWRDPRRIDIDLKFDHDDLTMVALAGTAWSIASTRKQLLTPLSALLPSTMPGPVALDARERDLPAHR
jgi:hypothetical protein